jgi:hypothetical protein
MPFFIAPNVNDETIVCQNPCTHRDCATMREDWIKNANCVKCGKPIEPGHGFCYTGNENNKWEKEHTYCD